MRHKFRGKLCGRQFPVYDALQAFRKQYGTAVFSEQYFRMALKCHLLGKGNIKINQAIHYKWKVTNYWIHFPDIKMFIATQVKEKQAMYRLEKELTHTNQ